MAFSNGCSGAFPDIISLVSGMFQRSVTFPVDLNWKCPMDVQWHFPMEFHFCDFWCVIVCPEIGRSALPVAAAPLHSRGRGCRCREGCSPATSLQFTGRNEKPNSQFQSTDFQSEGPKSQKRGPSRPRHSL